jgi:hypothetical protein
MSDHNDPLRKLAQRYVWLLSELHAGNEFSKDQLWRWVEEAEAAIRNAERVPTPRSG